MNLKYGYEEGGKRPDGQIKWEMKSFGDSKRQEEKIGNYKKGEKDGWEDGACWFLEGKRGRGRKNCWMIKIDRSY